VTAFAAISATPQTSTPESKTTSGAKTSPSQLKGARPQNKIYVHTEEVIVPITVTDKRGEPVLDLTQEDFRVLDNGVVQEITHWDLGGEPLILALVIETSSHNSRMAPVIRRIAPVFTENIMASDGEATVITYDSTVQVRQGFTGDHDAIQKAIGSVEFGPPDMKLYDAMAFAIQLLATRPIGRRIILVVGESQDSASEAKLKNVIRDAALNNIAIYAVGPSSTLADLRYGSTSQSGGMNLPPLPLPKSVPPVSTTDPPRDPLGHPRFDIGTPILWLLERGSNEIRNIRLEHAVMATGGVHYRALKDIAILTGLDKIGGELHAQYVVSFQPHSERPLAGFHEINVTVSRPGTIVRARPGYSIPPLPDRLEPQSKCN
jgi:VWFA-related protein